MPNANHEIIRNPERLAALRNLLLLDTPTDAAFDRLTHLAARLLKTPISMITLVDEDRQFLKSQIGLSDRWALSREMPLEYSYCQHVVAAGSPLIVEDSREHPLLEDNLATQEDGIVAYAGIPLVTSSGETIGSFCVIDKQPRAWTGDEIETLTELSHLVMPEIELHAELTRAEKTLEDSVERLTLLRRIDVELSESLDLESVLSIAMDTAQRTTGAKHGAIALLDGDRLRAVHTIGAYETGITFELDQGVVGRALRTQTPQLVLDVSADPDYVAHIPGIRAEIAIPLIHRDHLIGVLNLETPKAKHFTREAFDFLRMIASHVTIAIDNAQLYQVSQQQLDEMHQLYMRISELEQLKTDMIRIAAHDLRNPLGIVKGYSALLIEDRDTLTVDQSEYVQAIYDAGEKMLKIIRDILSLERVEAMQNKTNCDEIDFADMVRELAGGHSVRSRQKAQTYRLIVPDTPVPVCVEPGQMWEALDNLIGNAVKYTPNGGTVTVELSTTGEQAVFQVRDTGLGVAEEEQARLFQPFFRASNAKASDIEGTGLGLHLVKNIIERHGGKMRFKSTLGEGSTFGFELPLQRLAVSD